MNYNVTLTHDQIDFLLGLLGRTVTRCEDEAAALAPLGSEAARDLARERLDDSQKAAEIIPLLAQL